MVLLKRPNVNAQRRRHGVPYKVKQNIFDDPEPLIERDVIYLPECLINEYGPDPDYHRAVKPAFDALWNTAGHVSAQTFSAEGVWVPT